MVRCRKKEKEKEGKRWRRWSGTGYFNFLKHAKTFGNQKTNACSLVMTLANFETKIVGERIFSLWVQQYYFTFCGRRCSAPGK
jgi:hypothetical protein